MFGIQLGRSGGKLVLVADVGSASVGVAFLHTSTKGPGRILYADRSILPIAERPREATASALGAEIQTLTDKLLKIYVSKTKKNPSFDSVYCIFHPPWTHSGSGRATQASPTEEQITQQVIAKLAQESLSKISGLDTGNVLEASVVRVEVNGYPTSNPVGRRASEITVVSLMSDCDPVIRKATEGGLAAVAPHAPRFMRSATRALLSSMREKIENQDCLIVDMAGEGTAFTTVHEGVPVFQQSVPEGVRTVLRKIAPAASPDETLGLIRMLARDDCSDPACDQLQAALAKIEPELVRTFGEAMAKLAASRRLPEKLLLLTYPDTTAWFAHFFSRIDFTQFTQTTQPFSVQALSQKDFEAFVTWDEGVQVDAGIALSAALVNIEQMA